MSYSGLRRLAMVAVLLRRTPCRKACLTDQPGRDFGVLVAGSLQGARLRHEAEEEATAESEPAGPQMLFDPCRADLRYTGNAGQASPGCHRQLVCLPC